MVVEGFHGNRGLVPASPSVRLLDFSLPSPRRTPGSEREGSTAMEVVHPRCAGLDVSKRDAKVCVRVAGSGRRKSVERVTTWSSRTSQILALREHLAVEKVTCVVMEATGDYWKPFYYLLEDLPGVEVMLVNARHVKTLPGRKTDVADATWLAQLGAHGLVRGSGRIVERRDMQRASRRRSDLPPCAWMRASRRCIVAHLGWPRGPGPTFRRGYPPPPS